jgi:hypothetical protein
MAGENTPLLNTTVKFAKPPDNHGNISQRLRSTMAKASFRLNSLIEEHTGTDDSKVVVFSGIFSHHIFSLTP